MTEKYLGNAITGSLFGTPVGAKIVARAWTDPAFAEWLRVDSTKAIQSMGYHMRTIHSDATEHIVTVENTDQVHNMIVCTLCSCYPKSILGLPPTWYKSEAYRLMAVSNPRELLKEFDLYIDDDVEIKVWDSTAEIRYMVIPQRPWGTETWSVTKLESIITRDSLIGTAVLKV